MTTFENEFDIKYKNMVCICNKKHYTKHAVFSLVNLRECLDCGRIKVI